MKDIIGSFTPFLIAVLAQYVLNFIDVAILFFKNMRSDEKSNSDNTIGKILQMDYNQPMNQAYLVLAQHLFRGLVLPHILSGKYRFHRRNFRR